VSHPIRIGLDLSAEHPIEIQRQLWNVADEGGFDHLWHDDQMVAGKPGSLPDVPTLESWALLAAKAEATTRVRIGILVSQALLRHPAMLAKLAATVDRISDGRVDVGIGSGHGEYGFTMLGLAFPSRAERIGRMAEACSVMKALWTEHEATYTGRYYQLINAVSEPKPIQKPHPPLWIGGRGPTLTLGVVARHADVWNTTGGEGFDGDVRASRLLDEHCQSIGRDPAEIRRSAELWWTTADTVLPLAESYVRAGFTELILRLRPGDPIADANAAQATLPRLRSLAAT